MHTHPCQSLQHKFWGFEVLAKKFWEIFCLSLGDNVTQFHLLEIIFYSYWCLTGPHFLDNNTTSKKKILLAYFCSISGTSLFWPNTNHAQVSGKPFEQKFGSIKTKTCKLNSNIHWKFLHIDSHFQNKPWTQILWEACSKAC